MAWITETVRDYPLMFELWLMGQSEVSIVMQVSNGFYQDFVMKHSEVFV